MVGLVVYNKSNLCTVLKEMHTETLKTYDTQISKK